MCECGEPLLVEQGGGVSQTLSVHGEGTLPRSHDALKVGTKVMCKPSCESRDALGFVKSRGLGPGSKRVNRLNPIGAYSKVNTLQSAKPIEFTQNR